MRVLSRKNLHFHVLEQSVMCVFGCVILWMFVNNYFVFYPELFFFVSILIFSLFFCFLRTKWKMIAIRKRNNNIVKLKNRSKIQNKSFLKVWGCFLFVMIIIITIIIYGIMVSNEQEKEEVEANQKEQNGGNLSDYDDIKNIQKTIASSGAEIQRCVQNVSPTILSSP